jgi:tetratricopeptide (TPR) repeat protein
VELLSIIAFIKRRQGKWEEAATLLEKAAELNPHYFFTVVELGITYVSMRQYDKAERLLDRSIFLAPEDANGHVFKILVPLLRDGYVEKAEEELVAASEVVKPAVLGFDLQGFMLMRVMPEKYAELLNRVSPEEYGIEDTTAFHLGLAEIYHRLGQEEQARGYWEEELARLKSLRNPVFQYDIELCLGLAYAGLGRNEEAIRLAREAIAKAPLSADAFLGTFRLEVAALIFVRTGEYEEAIDQLELLLSVPSETSRASFRLDPAWDPLRNNPRFQKLVQEESSF